MAEPTPNPGASPDQRRRALDSVGPIAETLTSINPATGTEVDRYPVTTESGVDELLSAAARAQHEWSTTDFPTRATAMLRLADALDARRRELALLMAAEMGKPVTAGLAEIDKCAWCCRHYAERAEEYLADLHIAADRHRSYVHSTPLGVVLAVMPWNYPFWQAIRFLAPALMAGNGAVLKHASNVTGCALAIEDLIAGTDAFPSGLFATCVVPSSRVEKIIASPTIAAVTLTGSAPAGAAVAAAAGRHLKKTVLELGGSDPYVVLADADLDLAAETCATSRLTNSGQTCIAAKRFIVVDPVHDEFVDRVREAMAARRLGDPTLDETDLGPMARRDLREELADQVARGRAHGATLVLGGEVPDGPGAWYPPTLLTGVAPDNPLATEETFGPAGVVMSAGSEDEAIALANDTPFGLGAAVFTTDLERGEHIAADRLHAGCCFVNTMVVSDPRLPFGGVGESGYGRELAHLGISEFVNAKTVVVDGPT